MSQIVTTLDALHELVDAYMAFDCFALDTETMAGREPYHAKDIPEIDTLTNVVFWVSLAGPGRSDAIPIGHPLGRELRAAVRVTSAQPDCPDPKTCARCSQGWTYNKDGSLSRKKVAHNVPALFGPAPEQLTHEQVWPVLKPLLLGDARKIGHNIKFDAESVAKYLGEPMRGPFYDTQIAAQLINENHNAYTLGACSERDLHYVYDKSLGKAGVQNFSFEKAGRYARLDALAAWLLFKRQAPLLAKEKQHDLMYEVEAPIIEVVIDMELAGAPIDRPALERLEEDYRGKLVALQAEIEDYNGGPINLNAAAQIRELVYGKRGRKVLAVTQKTEEPATGIKALEKHAFKDPRLEDPFVPHNVKDKCVYAILDHARWHKVHSTYLANNLPAVRATGKLYGQFDQMGARTGRFSARSPNLQNIPVRQGKDIRALFIAGDGHKLIVNDYSQVELRILAHFTQDPLLLMAYHEGLDLHSATARTAYGIPEGEDPSTRQRSLAKNVNFCVPLDTQALTPEGWKHHDEIEPGDRVMGYKDGHLDWTVVKGKHYTEPTDLYEISSGNFRAVSTADHRWVVRRRRPEREMFRTTRELGIEDKLVLSAPSKHVGTVDPHDAAVVAWLLTDGHIKRSEDTGARQQAGGTRVGFHAAIHQKKTEQVAEIEALLAEVPHKRYERPTGIIEWRLAPAYARSLWQRCEIDKVGLQQFVLRMGAEARRAFVEAAWRAEGWMNGGSRMLAQNEGEVLEALRLAIFLEGHRPTQSSNGIYKGTTNYNLNFSKPTVTGARLKREAAGFDRAWCVETEAGTWVMRQGDQISVTGNSMVFGATSYTLVQKYEVPEDEAEALVTAFYRTYKKVAPWQAKVLSECRKRARSKRRHGYHQDPYVETILGRRRRLPDIILPDRREQVPGKDPGVTFSRLRARAERQAINTVIQGCLPADTTVLTRQGWQPIGEFEDGTEVWTGNEWAPATRLNRGAAMRLRLHLSDGRTFDCDDRHKLLTQAGTWPEWTDVNEIVGVPLVRDKGSEWGSDDRPVEDWYWVGRMLGDGHITRTWGLAFGPGEQASAEKFCAWLDSRRESFKGGTNSTTGYTVSRGPDGLVHQVCGGTAAGIAFWESYGLVRGAKSRAKRLPSVVFTLDLPRRQAVFDGYFDADGHERQRSTKITSVNRPLLEDMLRLLQTLGRSGKISAPMRNGAGVEWYDLYVHRDDAPLTVERVEPMAVETMYTLSVDHPRHAFSSEGVISKNTAADIMKVAMVRLHRRIKDEDLPFQILMQVHDEVVVRAPEDRAEEAEAIIRDSMESVNMLTVPLVAEGTICDRWDEGK